MPNLGSSNTPVEGASFGLPAGAELTEDANGNLAIADSSGSIVLVRDETNAEWQFENTDLTGINSIDAGSANLGSIGNTHEFASGYGSDETAAQNALDAQGTDPSTVHFDVEITALSSPLTIPSNTKVLVEEDITLAGSTQENILQNENLSSSKSGTVNDDTNIHIRGTGGVLDGNRQNNTSQADGGIQNCVCLIGVTDASVENVVAKSGANNGINVSGVDRIRLVGNICTDNFVNGVQSHFLSSQSRANTQVLMADNIVYDGGANAGQGAGIYAVGVTQHVIRGNHVEDRDNHGILVGGRTVGDGGIVVANNTVRQCTEVTTYYPQNGSILIETLSGGLAEVIVNGNTVDDFSATDNEQHGILVLADGDVISRVGIENNHVYSQKDAIKLDENGNGISDAYVGNNPHLEPSASDGRGISMVGVDQGTIEANQIRDTGLNHIIVEDCTDVSVTNNRGHNTGGADCLFVNNTTRAFVVGNVFRGSGSNYGINESNDTSDSVYLLNDVRGNPSGGTTLNGTGTITDPVGGGTAENWNVT